MLARVFRRADNQPQVIPAGEPARAQATPKPKPKFRIAVALGRRAARGRAHAGVLKALDEAGIHVSMIAGTSIGALVGGCYLAGRLGEIEDFARSLTRRGRTHFLDV